MILRPKRVLPALALAATLAACGSEAAPEDENQIDVDKEEVTAVAQAYVDALNAGDAEAACVYRPNLPPEVCAEITRRDLKEGDRVGGDFKTVTKVRLVEEHSACAYFDGSTGFIALSREEDTWRIGAPTSGTPLGGC